MEFQKSVTDVIRERKSCRTFLKKEIEPDNVRKLEAFISDTNSSIDIKARFLLATRKIEDNNKTEKLGTYGFISGAKSFIVGILDKEEKKAEYFGYNFEKIVLFATDLGLGTCWLAGTFSRSDLEKKLDLVRGEFIPVLSPVGYPKSRRRILDSMVRTMAKSDSRKHWNSIFFDASIKTPLAKSSLGNYETALEMVRIAPSASNKQPWRIIRDDNGYNFYIFRTKGYGLRSFDVQRNDLGIAMCHFELTLKELKLNGEWRNIKKNRQSDELEYAATWVSSEK